MEKFDIFTRRKELGLTLEDIGKACNVGKSTVKKWETGFIENMKRDKIALLANVLKVSPLEIMGIEEEKKEDETEIMQYLEELRTRPEMRMLFNVSSKATKEDVEKAVAIIEALRSTN
ncbi:MAG: helix-turn-helix transcriptional regulator [Ruminococcaceae bacterium]|nr:helix-turn-helix transcriptional regulator [Oscillospiraceae bacterium]